MNKTILTEKEFEIINVLADGFRANQRELSHHVGLSLGMTNLLLRRLATKGFLRIKQLNRKKVEYLVTPRSIAQKAQKTYHYTLKTIESFGLIRAQIRSLLQEEFHPGIRRIIVVGQGDLADLVRTILQELCSGTACIVDSSLQPPAMQDDKTLVIDASTNQKPNLSDSRNTINIMSTLTERLKVQGTRATTRDIR